MTLLLMEDSTRYQNREKLGEGTYGEVYKAFDTKENRFVAVKVMKPNQDDEGLSPVTLREISILKTIKHNNIVTLYDIEIVDKRITLYFEFFQLDLRKYLRSQRRHLDEGLVRSYAFQMLAAIYVLHSNRIMHRDIKPENILINEKGHLKICDFGLARYFSVPLRKYTTEIVSLWYRAPELLSGTRNYEISIDIWSAGCIIAEMSRGEPLFKADSEIDLLHKILSILGTPSDPSLIKPPQNITIPHYEPQDLSSILKTDDLFLVDLVSKMLCFDPKKRITAIDAINHEYFRKLPKLIRELSLNEIM